MGAGRGPKQHSGHGAGGGVLLVMTTTVLVISIIVEPFETKSCYYHDYDEQSQSDKVSQRGIVVVFLPGGQ